MYDHPHYFRTERGCSVAMLPFAADALIADWDSVRVPMTRRKPEEFSRGEWAFLIETLESQKLGGYFTDSFGASVASPPRCVTRLLRPRGTVAVWLPNNVSLLGPLVTIALTLTGNALRLKSGSNATDLTGAFLGAVLAGLRPGPLRTTLERRVTHDVFGRVDARNREWAESADVRIVFGSDQAAAEVHAYAPAQALPISFTDRRSVVWIEPGADTDETLASLIRVFAVYGTAGCTSPRHVVLLDSTPAQARELRDRLLALWPKVIREKPAMHIASANCLAWQASLAQGWDAALTCNHQAVLATGDAELPLVDGPGFLPVVSATRQRAAALLPPNIQTIGYALREPNRIEWLSELANTAVKRFVPIPQMHHFGATWDGRNFWRECFEEVEVRV